MRLGDLAEGPAATHTRVVAPGARRGRRSGKAPVVLGLPGVRWDIPGFARVLLGMLPSFTDFSDFLGRMFSHYSLFHMVLLQHAF